MTLPANKAVLIISSFPHLPLVWVHHTFSEMTDNIDHI